MRLLNCLLFIISTSLVCTSPGLADSSNIVKICSKTSDAVRYTNLDTIPDGYQRCGTVNSEAYCDPAGNRYYGSAEKTPYAYKNCSVGSRIKMEIDGESVDINKELSDRAVRDIKWHEDARQRRLQAKAAKENQQAAGVFGDYTGKKVNSNGLSVNEAFDKINELLDMTGTRGIVEHFLGEDTPDLNQTRDSINRHFDTYNSLPDDFFED